MNGREPRCPRCGEPICALRSQTVCGVCGTTLDWQALAAQADEPAVKKVPAARPRR